MGNWKLWRDDAGQPQWPTREPVRPKLYDDGQGWLVPALVREVKPYDWKAGIAGVIIVALLWAIAVVW